MTLFRVPVATVSPKKVMWVVPSISRMTVTSQSVEVPSPEIKVWVMVVLYNIMHRRIHYCWMEALLTHSFTILMSKMEELFSVIV